MLKEKSKIKLHLYSGGNEIITRNYNNIFEVYKKGEKLGIDWNTERSPYTCKGDIFTPFETFAQNVNFEDVESGKIYYFSNITNQLEQKEA